MLDFSILNVVSSVGLAGDDVAGSHCGVKLGLVAIRQLFCVRLRANGIVDLTVNN